MKTAVSLQPNAYLALVCEVFDTDIYAGIGRMKWERLDFECDNGDLMVVRER